MAQQNVDARIIDRNGFSGIKTSVAVREGGAALWLANQVKQMDGDSYITSLYNAAVANLANIDIRIDTAATRRVIFNVEGQSDRIRMRIYQNPTIAGGVALAAVPPDFGTNQVALFAYSAPVVTAVGAALRFDGFARALDTYIFTFQSNVGGVDYLVRFTNTSGAANDFSIHLETFV